MNTITNHELFVISPKSTIKQALETISANHRGGVIVVDKEGLVVGFVSDGEIRRALIKNMTLLTPVEKIMNINFVFSKNYSEEELEQKFLQHPEITLLPVLTEENKLKEIITK